MIAQLEHVLSVSPSVSANNRMQPTHQPVIKFECANLSPVCRVADA